MRSCQSILFRLSLKFKQRCQGNLIIKTSACHTVGQYLIPYNKWCQTHFFEVKHIFFLDWRQATTFQTRCDFISVIVETFYFLLKKNFTLKTRGIWQYYSTDKKLYTHDGRDGSAGPLVIISPSDVVKAAAKVLYSLEKRYATWEV